MVNPWVAELDRLVVHFQSIFSNFNNFMNKRKFDLNLGILLEGWDIMVISLLSTYKSSVSLQTNETSHQ